MTVSLVTRPLRDFTDGPINLTDVAGESGLLFVRDNTGFAASHAGMRVPLHQVSAFFADVHCDSTLDIPGGGGVALGWYPFDGNGGEAIVPEVCVGALKGHDSWVTFAKGCESQVLDLLQAAPTTVANPSEYVVRPGVPIDRYLAAVTTARDAVRAGRLAKAVIARDVVVDASQPIDVRTLLRRLAVSFGTSYRFSIDGFIGASPELLVRRSGDLVASQPLAGTTPRTGDPTVDLRLASELRASEKNQVEHRVVIDMVHDTLLPWCSYLDWQPEPEVVAVANVQHLGTQIEGQLSQPLPHVLDLVRALSPTPALGGHPRDTALRLIAENEGFARGRYGGAVGWCDAQGNGTWAVAIRCAELSLDRRQARLFAGGGIVADSDPRAELAETQAKFQAMLAAIVRP